MRLVDDVRDAWKWGSTRVLVVIAAIPPVWAELPDDAKAYVPEEWRPFVFSVLALAGFLLRITNWERR